MHEKKRLGILIETTDEYNLELIRGAQAAADESDAELVVFTGTGAQRRTHFEDFLNKNNMAYDYANIAGIDQLLVPVSNIILGSHMTTEQFLARYDIPLITLNYYNEHYSSVMYDAGKGVIDEVSFMISKGCRHIAFIGGPADRQGTKARFEAYKMALSYHQISLDFSLVCHCANYTSYNRDIIEPFLKAHPEIDGIFTVTDRLAYCVYDILHDLKKNIGKDILVGSFDDDSHSAYTNPPLASVHGDSALLAYLAGLEALAPHTDIFHSSVPTTFVSRSSLGSYFAMDDTLSEYLNQAYRNHCDADEIAHVLTIFLFDDRIVFDSVLKEEVTTFFRKVISIQEMPENFHHFLFVQLGHIITFTNMKFIDIGRFNAILVALFKARLQYDPDQIPLLTALQNDLFNHLILSYSAMAAQNSTDYDEDKLSLNISSRITMGVNQGQSIYDLIAESLTIMNVKNAMLLVFPEKIYFNREDDFIPPSMAFLKAHIKDGKPEKTLNTFYSLDDLLNHFPGNYKTVSTISFNEEQYGILLTDYPYEKLSDIEFLLSQFGTAFYITGILEKLNIQSITDELTGVFNRRGILEKLDETIATLRFDEFAYILFADLDRLKKINDQYGHEAGDQAIIGAASILTNAFPRDLVGRIGGDEFMVIIKTRYPAFIKTVDDRIVTQSENFALEHDYPFTVSIAYGMSVFDHNATPGEIKHLIDNADSFMYESKKRHHQLMDEKL